MAGALKKLFPESCKYEETGIGEYEFLQILKQAPLLTYSVRHPCSSIISQLFEDLDLTVKEDVSQDLKSSQISQNLTHLAKLIEIIKLTMNLFHAISKKVAYLI